MNLLATTRNITIIALILSLLFHASSVFYVFLQKTHNDVLTPQENYLNQTVEKEEQKKPWVETKAREGNFGAPVFFEDRDEDTPEDNKPAAMDYAENNEHEQELAPENALPDIQKSADEIEAPTHQEKKLDQTSMAPIESIQKPILRNDPIAQAPKQALPKKTISKTPPQKGAAPQKNPFTHYPSANNKQKPPITLAQITQGFLEQRKENSGSFGISMLGMQHGIPTDEQIKYERYLQKLSWCWQNACNIHRSKSPHVSIDSEIQLSFALNRDGILQDLTIRKSSGNRILDNFIVFVFQEASQSFPPVPSYLPDNPFQLTLVIPIKIVTY